MRFKTSLSSKTDENHLMAHGAIQAKLTRFCEALPQSGTQVGNKTAKAFSTPPKSLSREAAHLCCPGGSDGNECCLPRITGYQGAAVTLGTQELGHRSAGYPAGRRAGVRLPSRQDKPQRQPALSTGSSGIILLNDRVAKER